MTYQSKWSSLPLYQVWQGIFLQDPYRNGGDPGVIRRLTAAEGLLDSMGDCLDFSKG
jgi:hypothetical protein